MNPRTMLRLTSMIVAFTMMGWLAIAPPATADPATVTIQVVREAGQVCVRGITSAEIRLQDTAIGTATTSDPCPNLNPSGEEPPPIDLAPGLIVSVWEDGSKLDDLTIADVGITYVDASTATATGWVQPGEEVQIQFLREEWGSPDKTQSISDEGDGRWSATEATLQNDLAQVSASVFDDDGDFSGANRGADIPSITVFLDSDVLELHGFPPGTGGEAFADDTSVIEFTFDENGNARFDADEIGWFDFMTGQLVRVVSGSVTDELVLAGEITSTVDVDTNVISGTAPANAPIGLSISDVWLEEDPTTTSDGSGAWSIDTTSVYDLKESDGGFVWVTDEDGDQTAQEWPTPEPLTPHIDLTYYYDPYGGWWSIGGEGFDRFTEIQMDIAGEPFTCPSEVPEGEPWLTDPYGNLGCGDLWQMLEVGQTITVRVADDSDALTVRPLTVNPLIEGGTPSGTTEPTTEVTVWIDGGWGFIETTTTSNAEGVWSLTTPILEMSDNVTAWLPGQAFSRSVPFPRIFVEPQSQTVDAQEFPVPPGNTGETSYPGELRVTTPAGDVCAKMLEFWNGQSNVEMWSDDPAMGGPWCAINAGDTVTVTAEAVSKSLVVEPLTVASVDADAGIVTGTAGSDSEVGLSVENWETGNGAEAGATADGSGAWTISEMTDWNGDPWVASDSDWIQAYVVDGDGDQTLSTFVWPTLSVNPELDHVWGWGWPTATTITVNGQSFAAGSGCYANTAYWYHYMEPERGPYSLRPCDGLATGYPAVFLDLREPGVDIVPGDVVTMTDTTDRTASVQVADIRVTDVDMPNAVVTGSSNVPVQPNLLSALAMGWWELGTGDWEFRLTDHQFYPGPMKPGEFGVFRGAFPDDSGETVVRWYSPGYTFTGFTDPVDMLGIVNVGKAGKTIDLTFRLTAADQPVLGLSSANLLIQATSCSSGTADEIESYGKKTSGLQNLGNGYYLFKWNVPKSMAKTCQQVSINLGTYGTYPAQPAVFRFTK